MGAVVLIAIIVVIGYVVSIRLHPLRKCPSCKMTGRHFGSLYTGSYRRCGKCEGRGQLDRMGTKVFFGGTKNTGVFPKKR
jgi:DnaJ-class molecular chaperone